MSDQVNLLQETKVVKKEGGKLLSLSFLFLLLTVIIAVGILLYLFYLKTQEGNIITNQTESISSLSQFQDKKIMYQSTKERLASISQLLLTKNVQTDRFIDLATVIPSDVSISALSLSGNTAKLTLSSSSLSSINEFLEINLEELPENPELKIRRIQIDNLGIQSDSGVYSVGITIEFN